ncbi:unnamed protein product [Cladocopium goreaui]|uniref:Disulfide-bond oxidoreductase YghU (GSH-dependen t disulfide-bond oxidoreductase YghU) (GST N2-2) (Organic hydroperoxidase) n=1 Tax=Cladocopium goreaui TaxID=2562237 RepID=A0A9P1BYM9_9DINO|nr:unnamed protein product [Cladocopium goreaui]
MADGRKGPWVPPQRIEDLYERTSGNQFASINRPTAGARYEAKLEGGTEPLQLYSLATPNGWKVGILLEELEVAYDAHVVNIGAGEQFSSGFVGANPNSKIPALIDHDGPKSNSIAIMESGAIMLYLAEKYQRFIPHDARERCECLQWLFWQVGGQGPMTGNFGHFKVYAPDHEVEARDYGVARYGMEVQRLCSVLELHLSGLGDFSGAAVAQGPPREFLVGGSYSIADMACFPWVYMLYGKGYNRPGQPDAKVAAPPEETRPEVSAVNEEEEEDCIDFTALTEAQHAGADAAERRKRRAGTKESAKRRKRQKRENDILCVKQAGIALPSLHDVLKGNRKAIVIPSLKEALQQQNATDQESAPLAATPAAPAASPAMSQSAGEASSGSRPVNRGVCYDVGQLWGEIPSVPLGHRVPPGLAASERSGSACPKIG